MGTKSKVNARSISLVLLAIFFIGALIYISDDSEKKSTRQSRQRPLSNFDSSTFQKSPKISPKSPPKKSSVRPKKDKFKLTKDYFLQLYNDPRLVKQIQSRLNILGYPVGKVDGIIGPKTYVAFMQFIEDFQIRPRNNIAIELLSSLKNCATVAEVRPDFKNLIVTGELDSWIDTQPYELKKKLSPFKRFWRAA